MKTHFFCVCAKNKSHTMHNLFFLFNKYLLCARHHALSRGYEVNRTGVIPALTRQWVDRQKPSEHAPTIINYDECCEGNKGT